MRKSPALSALPLLGTAVAFILLPFVMPGGTLDLNPFTGDRFPIHPGFVDLASTIVVFALFALGFNLLFGHTGELSFGHAMFFAIGAYATALYTKGFDATLFGLPIKHGAGDNLFIALAIALLLAAAWGWLLAQLIIPRSSGIYYSMITMAFAQVIFFLTFRWADLTGGEDGLQAVQRPSLPVLGDWLSNNAGHFYIFTATIAFVAVVAMWWILNSPFGSVLHAIRENKQRARFLGYDVNKYRIWAFTISGLFPALAGWLWVYYQQSINPDASSIEYSGRVVMMSLLGGIGTFVGPMIGAFVYWELQNQVSQVTKYWEAAIGGVFVVFVLLAPNGIWGSFVAWRDGRRAAARAEAAPSIAEETVRVEHAK